MKAEAVVDLALEKLKEIAVAFDQFEGKDDTTFIEMSICDKYIYATLISEKKCDHCDKKEPIVHKYKFLSRKKA